MNLSPDDLRSSPDTVEEIEKITARLVTQAIYDYHNEAAAIVSAEADLIADIGEDITREALDKMGVSKIETRLFGKIDYKRARYVFHPEYSVRQALFVDSKAETVAGKGTATIQTGQTSMRIRQVRGGKEYDEAGGLPTFIEKEGLSYLTTTLFVKYNYAAGEGEKGQNRLVSITVSALPSGLLQDRYNPNADDTIWIAGRNAPTRGERFRVRLSFRRLKEKANWRVQRIMVWPQEPTSWFFES